MPKGRSEKKRDEGSLLGRAVEGHRDPELTCTLLSLTIPAAVRTGLSGWVWRREEGGGGGANCSMVGRCKSGRGRGDGAGLGAGGREHEGLRGRGWVAGSLAHLHLRCTKTHFSRPFLYLWHNHMRSRGHGATHTVIETLTPPGRLSTGLAAYTDACMPRRGREDPNIEYAQKETAYNYLQSKIMGPRSIFSH